MHNPTDKTSLKADREDWGEGGGLLLAPQLAPEREPQLAPQLTPQLTPQLATQLAPQLAPAGRTAPGIKGFKSSNELIN